jgi:hypothetical protein
VSPVSLDDCCILTARALARAQHQDAGREHVAGEFPMTLRCPEPRRDYNFLSGYALLHLAVTRRSLSPGLPPEARGLVERALRLGADLPVAYRSEQGTNNWYHGKLSGDRTPPDFPWPNGLVLSLRDDLDDTAIAALLTSLTSDGAPGPYRAEIFTAHAYRVGRDALRSSSLERLKAAGASDGVYLTWALDAGSVPLHLPPSPGRILLPFENSVEMVTVSNIYAAVHRLGGPAGCEAHGASARFVNAIARAAVAALLRGDPAPMAQAARYYPRAPFAPVGFLLRDHLLSDRTLLGDDTLCAIAAAARDADPFLGASSEPFAAPLHWLNAAAWCAVAGLLDWRTIRSRAAAVLDRLGAEHLDPETGWPDFVFFHDAHTGHYGGQAYSNAVALETFAALRSAELAADG